MLLALTWTAALCAGLSSPSSTEIIYDSLCITDRALYSSGIGNYCGGEDAIGGSYDLQTADNFLVKRDVFVTVVTSDSLTHLGPNQALNSARLPRWCHRCGSAQMERGGRAVA
ncbi:MAG: hypothetical protein AMXMBFR22_32720 [Phycisphaerae bacterium]